MEQYEHYLFVNVRAVRLQDQTDDPYDLETTNLYFFLGANFLVTAQAGPSPYVEELTDEMEREAEAVFAHIESLGNGSMLEGALVGIETGYYQREIAQAAYDIERKLNDGRHTMVGVTEFFEGNDEPPPDILEIGRECEEQQLKRLAEVKADRNQAAVDDALNRLRADATDPLVNLMPALLEAVRAYATVGETVDAMADVFGRYRETPVI